MGRSLQAAHTNHQYFAISVGGKINKGLGKERKGHRNEQSHPKVEKKTNTCPSRGNFPQPINKASPSHHRDGSVSMSMTAVDNVVLLPSAIILHYFELAGLSSGTILIPFMSWEFWRWATTAAHYKLEHNICCTEPQKLYRITERIQIGMETLNIKLLLMLDLKGNLMLPFFNVYNLFHIISTMKRSFSKLQLLGKCLSEKL